MKRTEKSLRDSERRKVRRILDEEFRLSENEKAKNRYQERRSLDEKLFNASVDAFKFQANQCTENNREGEQPVNILLASNEYDKDVQKFETKLKFFRNSSVCNICGIRKRHADLEELNIALIKNFLPSFEFNKTTIYVPKNTFSGQNENTYVICKTCKSYFQKKKVPKFCRLNIPIASLSENLKSLTEVEKLLLSPILPVVYMFKHKCHGQFKSYGGTVAFKNELKTIAKLLPRLPNEICFDVGPLFGRQGIVRVKMLRDAFQELKYVFKHPGFVDIDYSYENEKKISDIMTLYAHDERNRTKPSSSENSILEKEGEKCNVDGQELCEIDNRLLNPTKERGSFEKSGNNPVIENDVRECMMSQTVGIDPNYSEKETKEMFLSVLNSFSNGKSTPHYSISPTADWEMLFPTLLPDGMGGPYGVYTNITLSEWFQYVLNVEELAFSRDMTFLFYSHCIKRKGRISGVTACKPISEFVQNAAQELLKLSEKCTVMRNKFDEVSEKAVRALVNQVSFHMENLPGSVKDMSNFKRNLFTILSEYGSPSFFVTLSSADSLWIDSLIDLSNGVLNDDTAKSYTAKERGMLLSENPVAATLSFKRRFNALLGFILESKIKPLGDIKMYSVKHEWQNRGSEHVHLLFWCRDTPEMECDVDMKSGKLNVLNEEAIKKHAEKHISGWLPNYLPHSMEDVPDLNSNSVLTKDTDQDDSTVEDASKFVFEIQEPPLRRLERLITDEQKCKSLQRLMFGAQLHKCNKHCTNDFKIRCKSQFPFSISAMSYIEQSDSVSESQSFRLRIRRNHSFINPCNILLMNLWRANMDVTRVLGDAFGAVIYIALYTAKVEKHRDIGEILKKLRLLQDDCSPSVSQAVRKIIMTSENSKIISAPEVVHNLLGYPHWSISCDIKRIRTEPYMEEMLIIDKKSRKSESDSALMDTITDEQQTNINSSISSNNVDDDLTPIFRRINNTSITQDGESLFSREYANENHSDQAELNNSINFSKETEDYFNRPVELEAISQKEYIQKWSLHRRMKRPKSGVLYYKDKRDIFVLKRNEKENIILDVNFRTYPPDINSNKWCVIPLILHIPHRSVNELLSNHQSYVQAYKYFSSEIFGGQPKYPMLHKYASEENDLEYTRQNITRQNYFPNHKNGDLNEQRSTYKDQAENNSEKDCNDGNSDIDHVEDMNQLMDISGELDSFNDEDELCENKSKWNSTFINWNGMPKCNQNASLYYDEDNHKSIKQSIIDQKKYLNEKFDNDITEVEINRAYQRTNDPKLNGDEFKKKMLAFCKNEDQKSAIKIITTLIELYYFGSSTTALESSIFSNNNNNLESFNNSPYPFVALIGVPGSGKSTIISKIKQWVEIRIPLNCYPHGSIKNKIIDHVKSSNENEGFKYSIYELLSNMRPSKFGKSPSVAYSGAAAGVINGYTIHKALGFRRGELNYNVLSGKERLVRLSSKRRQTLKEHFKNAKILIIDEVYSINAVFFQIMNERMKDIFETNEFFGGLFVIIVGDARQIIPVVGKGLFSLQKYFNLQKDASNCENRMMPEDPSLKPIQTAIHLHPEEIKGFQLYGRLKYVVMLQTSIRQDNIEFAKLNQKIARYDVSKNDIDKINTYYKSPSQLQNEKWLNAIWLIPNWYKINNHLKIVRNFMANTIGIRRVWAIPHFPTEVSLEKKKSALISFFSTYPEIAQDYKAPLPYIDVFHGQYLNLKENFRPSMGFHTNAKLVVEGIFYENRTQMETYIQSVSQAVEACLSGNGMPQPEILVKFLTRKFDGPSALPTVSDVFTIPWVRRKVKFKNISFYVQSPYVHPANAISCHQSQGSTLPSTVAVLDESSERFYGMANVSLSRTSNNNNFALANKINLKRVVPQRNVSELVENEYKRLKVLADQTIARFEPNFTDEQFDFPRT